MSELDPIEFYDILKAHQRYIDALSTLASLLPDDDPLNPLLCVLSDSLDRSMVPVMVNGLKLSEAVTERFMSSE